MLFWNRFLSDILKVLLLFHWFIVFDLRDYFSFIRLNYKAVGLTVFKEVSLILRSKILDITFKLNSFILQLQKGRLKLELRTRKPLSPFHHTLFTHLKKANHDRLEFLKINCFGKRTTSVSCYSCLISRLYNDTWYDREKDLLGLVNECFRSHFEWIF